MPEERPLYNSRNIKVWIEYLQKFYPEADLDAILRHAGIGMYEIEDQGHWFTQTQIDRFYDVVLEWTADPQIARKAGQYIPFCDGLRYLNQFVKGFLNPLALYLLVNKASAYMSHGADITTRKIDHCQVEIVTTPKPGVDEKPYQCENRTGIFESIPQFFTGKLACVEHTECYHRGDACCRYILSWQESAASIWKRVRNITTAIAILISFVLFFVLTSTAWLMATLIIVLLASLSWIYQQYQDNRHLTQSIQNQSIQASDYMNEMTTQYNHAALIQEIGSFTANIIDEEDLVISVVQALEKRLDFDRGMIMLANKNRSRLLFSAGYGYDDRLQEVFLGMEFNLDNPNSKGVFVRSFHKQKPYLIDDMNTIAESFSSRSNQFLKMAGARALICVPVVYERQSLGILAVDNIKSKRILRQSDISLLSGIASQTAVGLINRRAFQKLIESEKKYRDLVENANSIILRRNPQGIITFFNEFAQRRFGYSEDKIIGKNIFGTILSDTENTLNDFDALTAALKDEPSKHIVKETECVLRNGEKVWIAWTHKPILDNDGSILEILCIGNDITQLRNAQSEKKELKIQLVRAQKMEALGTLAGGVAHDLNNILAGMVSYPDLLMLQLAEDDPMRKAVATIRKSGEKAATIVQDLLTLARRGVAVNDVLNLNDVVHEYIASPEHGKLKATFPRIDFEVNTEPSLLNITGSAIHLSKTLMNLVNNAAEAIENKGTVTITTRNRYVDRPIQGYDEVEKGDYSVLTVSDTGIGIPADDLERIFEPFFTQKKMGQSGTGLGMAVVWSTVKDHKGYLDIESEIGAGSTFNLFFPSSRQHRQNPALNTLFDDLKGNGETILIIDDMKDQREIAQEMLRCLNYDVATAESGNAAVSYLRTHRVDLVVLDMIMDPGIGGLETYGKILEIHPNQKAIITSGFSESDKVKQAQQLGAGKYVKKPYSTETIAEAIRNTLKN